MDPTLVTVGVAAAAVFSSAWRRLLQQRCPACNGRMWVRVRHEDRKMLRCEKCRQEFVRVGRGAFVTRAAWEQGVRDVPHARALPRGGGADK